jgi:hypothetical protein
VYQNGHARTVRAGEPCTVTDFDFTIDFSSVYSHADNMANVAVGAVPPHLPKHRGTHYLTFAASNGAHAGRRPTSLETSLWNAWTTYLNKRGRPPWLPIEEDEQFLLEYSTRNRGSFPPGLFARASDRLGPALPSDEEALLSLPTVEGSDAPLRAWCNTYCADPSLLKSFVIRKDVWGWDMKGVRMAIERAVLSTGFQSGAKGSSGVKITLECSDQVINVRPNNLLVRAMNSLFISILMWITLIYPLILIWQRISSRGGAPYEVATISYAMKFYPPLPGTFPAETVQQARDRLPALYKLHPELPRTPFLHRGPKGVHYLLGRREGEWFRAWEEAIRMGVRTRYQGELSIDRVDDASEGPALDGY